ncbi:MAG TPA: LutB/LldF family L-lactate oxidation iron-sulfur protein [Acidimicrobiales bacterium]|nr:LutB/LldF family L-lactate oxidation iron-sulfur protein [Acidimicrobiales bacterium]
MRGDGRQPPAATLRQRTATAVADDRLRANVAAAVDRFATHRQERLAELDGPDDLRRAARAVKQQVVADLPDLLERFADRVLAAGGHVCWAATAGDARRYVVDVVDRAGAARVAKSKSMVSEEIDLNPALEAAGVEVVETDLGEWIVQLAHEAPSHIIAPALHRDRHQIKDLFVDAVAAPATLDTAPAALVAFARRRLRDVFLTADVGITGVNLAVADTGSLVLVTNEGNGRLVTALPRVHVALLGMERLAADWHQAELLLALLARSATGQRLSSYTNVVTGPRGAGEVDGPEELHVVIVDNGRSDLLGGEYHEMLDCIRCGACLNVCPVYRQTGGHAYGWVYPGPMGAVLTPLLAADRPGAAEVAGASTLCGACMDACPVQIPLQDMLLALRRADAERSPGGERALWRAWSTAWSDRWGYEATTRAATWAGWAAGLAGHLPVGRSWAAGRAVPRPAPRRFRDRWRAGR